MYLLLSLLVPHRVPELMQKILIPATLAEACSSWNRNPWGFGLAKGLDNIFGEENKVKWLIAGMGRCSFFLMKRPEYCLNIQK
jgi:hypothetical protein